MADGTSSEVDVELLILRMAEKEQDALPLFLKTCGGKIKGFLTRRYGDVLKEQEIDEAVNRTAFNVWRHADRYTPAKGSWKAWVIRIARNAAISILRGENRNRAADLEHDPAYDPGDHCDEEPPEGCSTDRWRVQQLENIIDNELTGFEQALARADLAAGGSADSRRLAQIHGKSLNTVYATRSKTGAKIRKMIGEREASRGRPRGKP
jgi:DNA-directed RNA polymerase specialized sigma24 family protein